jgi:hypothetical protein
MMLGFDFLTKECGTLDLQSGVLSFTDGTAIHITSVLSSAACTAQHTHFGARTEMCFVAYCAEESLRGLDVVVTPDKQSSNVMLPKILTKVDDKGRLLLSASNWGTTPLTLPPGVVVGHVTPVTSEMAISELGQTYRPCDDKPTLDHSRVQLGNAQMTDEEWTAWWQMLDSFAHLFPTSEQPLGRTANTTHSIYTGDAVPIRGKPYRMGPRQQTLVQEKLNTML